MLLNEKRVNEALQLAHVAMETMSGPQRDEKVLDELVCSWWLLLLQT